MRRKLPGTRPVAGPAAAVAAVLAVTMSGCGGSSAGGASSTGASSTGASSSGASQSGASSSGSAGGSVLSPAAGSSPGDSLALSRMKVLTRLRSAQLCGLVSAAQAARILGAPTAAPEYAGEKGLGITCVWARRGAAPVAADELHVGISASIDWSGAQAVDQQLRHASRVTVDGHPAMAARPQGRIDWAQVDVALGGDHDPFADYRAPKLAAALALARAATPLIIARG
jgi:hypothetical protein